MQWERKKRWQLLRLDYAEHLREHVRMLPQELRRLWLRRCVERFRSGHPIEAALYQALVDVRRHAAGIQPKNATPYASTGYAETENRGGPNFGPLPTNSADLIGLANRLLALPEADRAKLLRLLADDGQS